VKQTSKQTNKQTERGDNTRGDKCFVLHCYHKENLSLPFSLYLPLSLPLPFQRERQRQR
jgi:hypothetical protein